MPTENQQQKLFPLITDTNDRLLEWLAGNCLFHQIQAQRKEGAKERRCWYGFLCNANVGTCFLSSDKCKCFTKILFKACVLMHYKSEAKRHASINELPRAVLLIPRKREKAKERKREHIWFNVRLINKETNAIHVRKMVELSHISVYSGNLI